MVISMWYNHIDTSATSHQFTIKVTAFKPIREAGYGKAKE